MSVWHVKLSGASAAALERLGSLSMLNRASASEIAPGVYQETRLIEVNQVMNESEGRQIQL